MLDGPVAARLVAELRLRPAPGTGGFGGRPRCRAGSSTWRG
ncbi:hypothetical protein ACFQ0B_21440 [Nonomuraea thailandensis]